jgi:hypothetical protein
MKNNNEYLLLNFIKLYISTHEIWKSNNEYLLLNFKTI